MKKRNFTQLFFVAAMTLLGVQSAMAAVSDPPEAIPATPTHESASVLSAFSGAYTNATNISGFIGPGTSLVATVLGDEMVSMNAGLSGWTYINFETPLNINDYDSIYMDVYLVASPFTMKLRFNASSGYTLSTQIIEGWNRVKVNIDDLRALATPPDFTNISSIGFINGAGYARTIYIDNIYAYKKDVSTDMKIQSNEISTSIYPNPVIDKVYVESKVVINAIQVFNLAGQNIKTVQVKGNRLNVNLQDNLKGVYTLQILLEDGSIITKKIVKI